MKHAIIGMLACALLGAASAAGADEQTDPHVGDGARRAKPSKSRKAEDWRPLAAKPKSVTRRAPRVDINNASLEQLKTLPAIGAAEAAQIIAGRPYGSKAWLVTKGIVSEATYAGIRKLVVAGTPSPQDAAKNPGVFGNKP